MKKYKSVIIVLCGGELSKENSWRSVSRIECAINKFYECNDACLVISSGVSGHEQLNKTPESHEYLSWILKKYPQINKKRIFVEDFSRDTVGNVYFTMLLVKTIAKKKAVLYWISNKFHIARLNMIVDFAIGRRWKSKYISVIDENEAMNDEIANSELESSLRFINDSRKAKNITELIFRTHDFYSRDRFFLKEML